MYAGAAVQILEFFHIGSVGESLQWIGAGLVLLGSLFPWLTNVMPRPLRSFWNFSYRFPSWFIVQFVVLDFVRAVYWMTNTLSSRISKLLIVLSMAGVAVFAAFYIPAEFGDVASSAPNQTTIVAVSVLAALASVFMQFRSGAIYRLLERRKHIAIYKAEKRRVERIESDISQLGSEASEGTLSFLNRVLDRSVIARDEARDRADDLNDTDLLKKAHTQKVDVFTISAIVLVAMISAWIFTYLPYTSSLLQRETQDALVLLVFLLPFPIMSVVYLQTFIPVFVSLRKSHDGISSVDPFGERTIFLLLFGGIVSFFWTFSALVLGQVLEPSAPVPQTFQLLFVNTVLDSLTIVATLWLLMFAFRHASGWLTAPVLVFAIGMDILLAALFAVLSLYLGLLGNPEFALTIRECVSVLWGLSPDGSVREFGPYFWVMHTVFLPTMVYLGMLMIVLIARLTAFVFAIVLRRANNIEWPATGTLLGALGTIIRPFF